MGYDWNNALQPGETLVDLERDGLYLIQSPAVFPCGQDSVLLSDFATLRRDDTALDLGCGTGVLAILCHAKHKAAFMLIDRASAAVDIARRNMQGNDLDFPVHAVNWLDAPAVLGHGMFSAVVCNPPYYAVDGMHPSTAQSSARQEEEGSLASACESAFLLLKNGGRFYCCYPAGRLADAVYALRVNRLEPKRLVLACGNTPGKPYLALIEAKKDAHPGMTVTVL
ncbi:MAG: methyltransferase [Eubacteriales bacterium]|nr:methyltransferase [Eubacteriales bacterium]